MTVPQSRRAVPLLALVVGIAVESALAAPPERKARPAPGYIREMPPESPADRDARRRRIARRRSGPVIIVHRGASAFAPENTLEAYAAAMDYGADGCELDLRRTADGILVLFHDDMLDHLTDGFGTVPQLTYYELLSLRPRFIYGGANSRTRPPTVAAMLALARQRAMLLHLDVKETGLEADIARLLTRADVWDHVVAVNTAAAPVLARDPRLHLSRYKVSGLQEERKDMDPAIVRDALAHAGDMIMVDDPRLAARELKRPPYQPVPLPTGLRREYSPAEAPAPADGSLSPMLHLRSVDVDGRSNRALQALLQQHLAELRSSPDGPPDSQRRRTEAIVEHARAAQELGRRGVKTRRIVELLEDQVTHRTLHRDWMYHGLDGAMAARALGMLGATESVPLLVNAFRTVDPQLKSVADPRFSRNPLGWTDFRLKMYILPALGELRCAGSKRFLQEYLAMDESRARELAPLLYEDATKALMRQDLSRAEIEALLRDRRTAVRGTAVLECLDHPDRLRLAALAAAAPWALELPHAGK